MSWRTRLVASRWCSNSVKSAKLNKPPISEKNENTSSSLKNNTISNKEDGEEEIKKDPKAKKVLPESLFRKKKRIKSENSETDQVPDGTKVSQNVTDAKEIQPVKPRRKMTGLFGEEGFEDDTIKKMQKQADILRGKVSSEDAPVAGQGPKPVWTFVDAGPAHWWPSGEWSLGAPPDVYGNKAPAIQLKKSPSVVIKRSVSSTQRMRETHDVWLTNMGPINRLALSIVKRLNTKEIEQLKFAFTMSKALFAAVALVVSYMLYGQYNRWKSFDAYKSGLDGKLAKICIDMEGCRSVRGKEYDDWLIDFWATVPMPKDFPSELEFIWRELIKKGWIELDKSEEYLIAEPFRMVYIPMKGAAVSIEQLFKK